MVNDQSHIGLNSSGQSVIHQSSIAEPQQCDDETLDEEGVTVIDPLSHSKRFTHSTLDPLMDYNT